MSERDLPVGNARIKQFFESHILAGLGDSQTKAAKFIVLKDRAYSWTQKILSVPADFIDMSQKLASDLYDVMKKDARVSEATLAVATYHADENGATRKYVALLKLDPSDQFRYVTKTDPAGLKYVDLEISPDVLPTTRERLHKCAFVPKVDLQGDYHFLLLDRQTAAAAARFFISDFLGAELAYDDFRRTEDLYDALQEAKTKVAHRLSASELVAFDQSIRGVLSSPAVDLDGWLPTLPIEAEARSQVEEVVDQAMPDRQFEIAESFRNRLAKRRRFKGDNGLVVQVDPLFFDDMFDIQDVPGTDPPLRRVVITTQKWEEVL